jgi:hypothetical protein
MRRGMAVVTEDPLALGGMGTKKKAGPISGTGLLLLQAGIRPAQKDYFIIGTISSATMLMTLIIGLIAGPAVSL